MSKEVLICPKCYSKSLTKYDIYIYRLEKPKTRYQCKDCGRLTIYPLIKTLATRRKKNESTIN